MNSYAYLIHSMPKTYLTRIPDIDLWARIKAQLIILMIGYLTLLLKASLWGSIFGPRIFLWPCFLFYMSIFATPIASILQILIFGLINDSLFNIPLGISSFLWVSSYWFLAKQRRFLIKSSFGLLWQIFAFFIIIINLLENFIAINTNIFVEVNQSLIDTFFNIGFFPITMHFFHKFFLRIGNEHD